MKGTTLELATLIFFVCFWAVVIIWWFLSGLKRKIKIVTITGPSGAGKTTVVGELLKRHPDWGMVISLTSRESRDSDLPGEYRCNLSVKYLRQLDKEGKALWLEGEHGNVYVTLFKDVNEARFSKTLFFMQILPKSVVKLRSYIPQEVLSIFVLPPSEEELRRRLAGPERKESPESIDRRIADCRKWVGEARFSGIPYKFVRNDGTVERTVERIEEIIKRNT